MEESTAQRTIQYIDTRPHIKWCLAHDLLNCNALARKIAQEIGKTKPASEAAIVVAASRYGKTLHVQKEKQLHEILTESSLEIRTRMCVGVLEDPISEKIRTRFGKNSILIPGTNHTTAIFDETTREKLGNLTQEFARMSRGLALLVVKSPKEIELTSGVCAFMTGLFAQNGVNIREFLSCWTETMFVIEQKDVSRAVTFLTDIQR